MKSHRPNRPTRRAFLRTCLTTPATFALAACAGEAAGNTTPAPDAPPASDAPQPTAAPPTTMPTVASAAAPTAAPTQPPPTEPPPTQVAQVLPPTPACGDDDDVTPAQTEGPYYTPNTPERTSLIEPGVTGTRLVVAGTVLTTGCQPVARALLDFWQADDSGAYDNVGYRLRGHQFTDDQGRYTLDTVVPGLYPGRTRHIHVKVQAPNQPILTTQLYFPDEPSNDADRIFVPELLTTVQDTDSGRLATFNFVLDVT